MMPLDAHPAGVTPARFNALREKLALAAGSDELSSLATGTPPPQSQEAWEESSVWEGAGTALRKIQEADFENLSDEELGLLAAIVVREARPLAPVVNGSFNALPDPWTHFNDPAIRQTIEAAIPSIGLVSASSENGGMPIHIGSGFIVGKRLVMTARHVAEVFLRIRVAGRQAVFLPGRVATLSLSDDGGGEVFQIISNVMVHPVLDFALFETDALPSSAKPLRLSVTPPEKLVDRQIVMIGYPGRSHGGSDVAIVLETQLLANVYGVKRIGPGEIVGVNEITSYGQRVPALTCDFATIGTSSGAAVLDVVTGEIVGMCVQADALLGTSALAMHTLARDARVVQAGLHFAGAVAPSTEWESSWQAVESGEKGAAPDAKPVVEALVAFAPTTGPVPFADGEIAALLDRLQNASANLKCENDMGEKLRHAAAVLAAFDPATLRPVGEEFPLDEKSARAALELDILPNPYGENDDDLPWSLAPGARKRALRAMHTAANMQTALAANPGEASPIPIQDILSRAIRKEPFVLAELQAEDLAMLATVADWLEGTEPGAMLPPPSVILPLIESRRDRALLHQLSSDTFMGRQHELDWILAHLNGQTPEIFFVASQGGMGKSALISRALLKWEGDRSGIGPAPQASTRESEKLWVRVDMHHSLVDAENPASVLRRAAQQMTRTHPGYSRWLTEFVKSSEQSESHQSRPDLESVSAGAWSEPAFENEFLRISGYILRETRHRMLLWIDTFEEAQFLGEEVAERLIQMASRLTSALPRIRILISGRALPPSVEKHGIKLPSDQAPGGSLEIVRQENPALQALVLKELPPPTAAGLLTKLVKRAQKTGTPSQLAPELIPHAAVMLGGNPLTLRLAAPVLAAEGGKDVGQLSEIAEEARQKYLVSRIVAHLHDARLEKIFLPSLELRVISSAVIREILAAPCGLPGLSEELSIRLFNRLQRELTLVEPVSGTSKEIRYRQDIRMIMLRERKEALPQQAREIHQRAVQWWRKQTGTLARAEELYHRLRLGEGVKKMESRWIHEAGQLLRSTLEELPEGSRQRLWLAGKLNVVLQAGESEDAAQADWEQQAAVEAQRLLVERNPQEALAVLARRSDRLPGSPLYALESRAQLFAGETDRALLTSWAGIAACREEFKSVAIDLALLAGFINERKGDFPAARQAVAEGVTIARQTKDKILQLRALLRAQRLQRLAAKQRKSKGAYPAMLLQTVRSVSEAQLRGNPSLLRELATELGVTDPHYLRLASEVLLEEVLSSIPQGELIRLMEQLKLIGTRELPLLSAVGRQAELVKLARSRCEERLRQKPSTALKPFYVALQELFRRSMDSALHKEYTPFSGGHPDVAPLSRARSPSLPLPAPNGPLPRSNPLSRQLVRVIGSAPQDWLDTIVRHVLVDDIARLGYGLKHDEIAPEIVRLADELGRLPKLIKGVGVLLSPDSKTYRQIRQAFQKWSHHGQGGRRSISAKPARAESKTSEPPHTMPTPKRKSKPITIDQLQQQVLEGTISSKELGTYFIELPATEDNLEPIFMLDPKKVVIPAEEATLESALLMNTANTLYSWLRKRAYEKKVKNGGPDLIRVIAEGDSWFQYPKILWDVIDKLCERPDIAIRCFSAAGDVLSNMVTTPQFVEAIRSEKPKYFLLSGGGNDLVDGMGLRLLLKRYDPALKPAQYLNENYDAFRARIIRLYKDILTLIFRESPSIHVICHGYAYAIPNSKRGPWLGKPMEELGIKDPALQLSIMKVVVDDIQKAIKDGIAAATKDTIFKATFVDNRKTIPIDEKCWHDEFHPVDEYFAKVAQKIGALIK
jgi:hypothetical protein